MPRIVLMGEPGSGKTTLTRELSRILKARLLEASQAVIYPMAALSSRWPTEGVALERLAHPSAKKPAPLSRDEAREVFSRLRKTYSPDFIARGLHARCFARSENETTLLSGLRGLENAEYCRLHNDFVIYLDVDEPTLVRRLQEGRGYSAAQARRELKEERALYKTREIKKIAQLVVHANTRSIKETARLIARAIQDEYRMCRRCVNTARNPAITFDRQGYCQICRAYLKGLDVGHLRKEVDLLKGFKGTGSRGYDVMVGLSGGKDSTATLITVKKLGLRALAFTFDTGYLPKTTIPRARAVAKRLGVDHAVIDIRGYARPTDRASYEKTAALHERPFSLATKRVFLATYKENRHHYSAKCPHALPFVRTCQICRRLVIRAYYAEARKRAIPAIVLGMNEWTNLSAAQTGGGFRVSGIRKLQPVPGEPPVHLFHLPFLLQRTSAQTKRLLKKFGWQEPAGEAFIESNSNSCLFARATERMAKRLLGFHPDATRLAREVTVRFISKRQALKALGKIHLYADTPREVLRKAGFQKRKG